MLEIDFQHILSKLYSAACLFYHLLVGAINRSIYREFAWVAMVEIVALETLQFFDFKSKSHFQNATNF